MAARSKSRGGQVAGSPDGDEAARRRGGLAGGSVGASGHVHGGIHAGVVKVALPDAADLLGGGLLLEVGEGTVRFGDDLPAGLLVSGEEVESDDLPAVGGID